ncbi:amidohydrolase family protein [Siccirubricoccus sp. KC 17139]|uniref:Amidohydrolase family protein n=1 Tax=Siccirubricoccus soli TaxID=2899147 RepID=A0ABT1D517_9PROT|nr:amidohydrolase family protein [Siccirubricoccus soli]MCO6416959.1 amidohydrolase family protein [Siccirubricoccus soli]MCP2683094.1 amidohydrolase family protein [Siccirubricoccus soli]
MAKAAKGFTHITGGLLAETAARRGTPADILIEDGIIRAVGPNLEAPEGTTEVDASGMLLHPGLINAHTHGHTGLGKGQLDKVTLELLLATAPWIGGSRTTEDKKLSTLICAAEMIAKGCTAAYDLYYEFPLPTQEGFAAAAEAYAEAGMRAVIAPMVADRSFYEAIPGLYEALPEALQKPVDRLKLLPWQQTLAAIEAILKNWRWAGEDILPAVAPTIPLHCADAFMCGCARLAKEHGIGLHSHVGESKVQAVVGRKTYGKTLIAHMDGLGLLGPNFTAAHAVWLDDDDFRRMADHGASMAHNPGSNMRLGNGMFRLRQALDAGCNVGIGTDGATCADNQNMYEAMRYASMLSKVQTPDPRCWATSDEVYRAATLGSAKALGFKDLGLLAPGYKADIVFLDLGSINWIPHHWSTNQIVHTEDGNGVRHVMTGGTFVFRDGRHTMIDLAKLAREAEAARARLEALNAEWRDLYRKLEPIVGSFCPAIAAQPYHLKRYLCDAPA